MAVSGAPRLAELIATFGGDGRFTNYRRGGGLVPDIPANGNISPYADGLRLASFAGATNSAPLAIGVSWTSRNFYGEGTQITGTVAGSITVSASGGSGVYGISATALSVSNGGNALTPFVNGWNIAINASTASFTTVVWRINLWDSAGASTWIDVTAVYNWVRDILLPSCVVVESILSPYDTSVRAGNVQCDDSLWITDPYTGDATVTPGLVRKSQTHRRPCVRIRTATGATLCCSTTAPIPTREDGYVDANSLLGHHVPTAIASALRNGDLSQIIWTPVIAVEDIGERDVQLLYVDDRAFWASDDGDTFILHHNAKAIL